MLPPPSRAKRFWRFVVVVHLYGFLAALVLFFVAAGVGLYAWNRADIRRKVFSELHSELIRLYLRDVAPRLPFTIEKIDVDANWQEFRAGNLPRLEARLLWDGWVIDLAGPAHFTLDRATKRVEASFAPEMRLTPPAWLNVPPLPVLPLKLDIRAAEKFRSLESLTLSSDVPSWAAAQWHLKLEGISLSAKWDGERLAGRLALLRGEVTVPPPPPPPDDDYLDAVKEAPPTRKIVVHDLDLALNTRLLLRPFAVGPQVDFMLTSTGGESDWGKTHLKLPLGSLPVTGTFTLPSAPGADSRLEIRAGTGKSPGLWLASSFGATALAVEWRVKPLPLPELVTAALAIGRAGTLTYLKKLSGTLQSTGKIKLPLPLPPNPEEAVKGKADFRLRDVAFEWPWQYLAVKGLDLDLPVSSKHGLQGEVEIAKVLYRRVRASLGPTQLAITPQGKGLLHYKIHLGAPGGAFFPLNVDGTQLKIGSVDGTVDLPNTDKDTINYDLDTGLQLEVKDPEAVLDDFCVKLPHIPPLALSVNFPDVELKPDAIEPTGEARLDAFGGSMKVSDIAIEALDTSKPELDFSFDVDGVRLDLLGDWSGFGEMDGYLHAYAHDVVLKDWIPTQFDFLLEAKRREHPKVVFSSEAMENVARLVAASSMDAMPGVAKWLAFGWPSKMLLGGFDVWFAGISLFSKDGSILLETLDPPDLPLEIRQKQEENHYILFGNRFSIPLNTIRYPVVVSTEAMGRYLDGALAKLGRLHNKRQAKEKKREKPQLDCAPPTI